MPIDEAQGHAVARYARACIREALGGPRPQRPSGFEALGATFVTLHFGDVLHGCIGSIEARRSLVDDVARNAVAAALHDPRATPLALAEVDSLTVEVSVLSRLEPIGFCDEASARVALRPFIDGVVLRIGSHQGTFLPQVWASLPDAADFLDELKRKAGLPRSFWSDGIQLLRYTVQKFADPARARYKDVASV